MYLNSVLFDNSITSSITYYMLSMELNFMICKTIFMSWQITIANYKVYVSATGKTNVSSTHQVSLVCSSHVATPMYCLCV